MTDLSQLDWLERWALYSPNATAFLNAENGQSYSYQKIYQLSCWLAHFLRERFPIEKGDRVAILATNQLETYFLFFALMRLGAILVPLNFRLTGQELAPILADAAPKVLFYEKQFSTLIDQLSAQIPAVSLFPFDGPTSLLFHLQNNSSPNNSHIPILGPAENPVMLLYTSGTTGRPKGALITHKMLFWNSISTSLRLQITPTDISLSFLPLFHTSGWNVLTTPFLHHGAKIIFLKKFDPEHVLTLCEKEKVTILFGVPTTMTKMAESEIFPRISLASLRFAVVGGEAMPLSTIKIWQERGISIRQGYGLTEFGPNVFSLNAMDSLRKIGSIGFPNFYIDAKLVDENGMDVPLGQSGELLLRGPACTPGYWRNPEATAATIRDGWLHTGDIMRQDRDGYFYVVDRKKDMYISGGENIYPLEIEHYLRTHPLITEAAVVGIPDPEWGECGKAFIVTKAQATLSESMILDFCRRGLAKYKVPKQIEFITELPKNANGKILKRALRAYPRTYSQRTLNNLCSDQTSPG